MELKDLKYDQHNYRKHNDKNNRLIKKSINEVGFGRSIVIDSENEIVCGNGVVSQANKNTPVKIIETDGSELVVIKRIDLKTQDAKRKKLAIMDNSTSDTSEFDLTLLNEDFNIEELQDFGILDEIKEIPEENIIEEDEEVQNIQSDYERIIITYKPEDKEKLENLLCITSINQVIYEFKDGELI